MSVGRWISEWIWALKTFGSKGETIIVLDDDRDGMLVAFGTWKHVERIGSVVMPRHIEIAWFGVHSEYQGTEYEDRSGEGTAEARDEVLDEQDAGEPEVVDEATARTYTVAEVAYAEVERSAREHKESTKDMPITLTCHVDNAAALAFYAKIGFKLIPDPKLRVEGEDGIYYRLVR